MKLLPIVTLVIAGAALTACGTSYAIIASTKRPTPITMVRNANTTTTWCIGHTAMTTRMSSMCSPPTAWRPRRSG